MTAPDTSKTTTIDETSSTDATQPDNTRAVWLGLGPFVIAGAAAFALWGIAASAMIALTLVPICFVMLIVLSIGK